MVCSCAWPQPQQARVENGLADEREVVLAERAPVLLVDRAGEALAGDLGEDSRDAVLPDLAHDGGANVYPILPARFAEPSWQIKRKKSKRSNN